MFDEAGRVPLNAAQTPEKPTQMGAEVQLLTAIDVGEELATNYQKAVELRDLCLYDPEIPANQKAQVLNSVLSITKTLAEVRTALFDAERMRRIEIALVRVLQKYPDVKAEFLREFGDALTDC